MKQTPKMIQLGACLEHITPGIRYDKTLPGESFERDISRLREQYKQSQDESLGHLLMVIDRLTEFSPQDFIKIVAIFEGDLAHRGLER